MTGVLDASAAVRLTLSRSQVPELHELCNGLDVMLAPELFVAEVTNTLWKYARAREVSHSECEQALKKALEMADVIVRMESMAQEVLAMAMRMGHSAYDMYYCLLAIRSGAILLTTDEKLRTAARRLGIKTAI